MEVTERKNRDKGLKSDKSACFNQLHQFQTHKAAMTMIIKYMTDESRRIKAENIKRHALVSQVGSGLDKSSYLIQKFLKEQKKVFKKQCGELRQRGKEHREESRRREEIMPSLIKQNAGQMHFCQNAQWYDEVVPKIFHKGNKGGCNDKAQ